MPNYISNITNAKYEPKLIKGVCNDVEWALAEANFHFEVGDVPKFMNQLIGWELIFNCRAISLANGTSVTASKQKNVIVSLWRRPGNSAAQREVRLTARWVGEPHSKGEHRWTTALISTNSVCSANGTKVVLKDVDLSRGTQLDIKALTAVDSQGKFEHQRKKALVLTLPDHSAAQKMGSCVSQVLHPMITDQDPVLWRPQSYVTTTMTGLSSGVSSSNEASKFLHRI